MKKKGQLEIGFNWIYVLIAGTVILLFFIGIVVKQKVVSEEKLSATVLRKIDGIFIGAGLSEKTINVIEIPKLTLQFTCNDADGYSDYAIKGTGVRAETLWQPVFAPAEMTGRRLVTWTLEWRMPFKVINYLFISSPNIKYYVFYDEYVLPEQFNSESVNTREEVRYNNEDQVRLVFGPDSSGLISQGVPSALEKLDDEKVTAVAFTNEGITFYQKNGNDFLRLGVVPWVGSFPEDDNPNVYGAIFNTDFESYKCNLKKGFERLEILSRVYEGRTLDLKQYYAESEPSGVCSASYKVKLFDDLNKMASDCVGGIGDSCADDSFAQQIESGNNYIRDNTNCRLIY